jgi:hypothetical protein
VEVPDVEERWISARRLRTTEERPRLTMEGLCGLPCEVLLEELARGLMLGKGPGPRSFSRVSTWFPWLGVISAENCSPDGNWSRASEEGVPVLPERMDEASLESGEGSRLGDSADSVSIIATSSCLLERSGTGELEGAS